MAYVNMKFATTEASRLCGEHEVMDQTARMIQAKARTRAREHRASGDYTDSIKIFTDQRPVVKDRLVLATDWAAKSIEWGHAARRSDKREGPAKWIRGQFIMTETFNEL